MSLLDTMSKCLSMWKKRDQNLSHMCPQGTRLARKKREGSSFQEDTPDKHCTWCCQKRDCRYLHHMHYRNFDQSLSSRSQQDRTGIEKG
jgi:hypothetical protein